MQDGSKKILFSRNKLTGTLLVSLDEIHSLLDNLQDRAFDEALKKSLSLKGMLNPIIVCSDVDFKRTDIRRFERRKVPESINQSYRCLIGNNRYHYAKNSGYTHIECFLVRTYDEAKKAHLDTQIEPTKM